MLLNKKRICILPLGSKGGAFSGFATAEFPSAQNFYVKDDAFWDNTFWFPSLIIAKNLNLSL